MLERFKGYGSPFRYHVVNGFCSLSFFGLYSFYLGEESYILWALWLSIAGCLLQFEAGVQNLGIRKISRQFHTSGVVSAPETFKWYLGLAAGTILVFLVFFVLFSRSDRVSTTSDQIGFWVFAFTYLINFLFGINNCVLLGAGDLGSFYQSLSISRIAHFLSSWLFLHLSLGILGLSVSFLLSVLVGVSLIGWHASKRRNTCAEPAKFEPPEDSRGGFFRFVVFSLMAFWIYRGVILCLVSIGIEGPGLGDYLFTINLLSMAAVIATVPFQVRLPVLVKLIFQGNRKSKELAKLLTVSIGLFLSFSVGLFLFATGLQRVSGATFGLVDAPDFALVTTVLSIEVFLAGMGLFFATLEDYSFVVPYCLSVLVGTIVAAFIFHGTRDFTHLVAIPALFQLLIAAPVVTGRALRVT